MKRLALDNGEKFVAPAVRDWINAVSAKTT